MKVFIATTTFGVFSDKPIDLLKKNGFKIFLNKKKRKLTENEIKQCVNDCDAVIAGTENYSKTVINSLPKLKVISRVGVGIDNIDEEVAKKKKIKILKTRSSPSRSVAELALGLILDCSRHITNQSNDLKSNKWSKQTGNLFSYKKVGIIGLGSIGKEFVKITKGFNLDYFAYDKVKDSIFAKKNNIKFISLKKIFLTCDIITIHLNYTKDNEKIINKDLFNIVKDNVILINTSRGEIIDEKSLLRSMKKNNLAAIGLDVFNKEPYSGDLIKYNNTVLTPHIGSYSKEVRIAMEYEAASNIVKSFK